MKQTLLALLVIVLGAALTFFLINKRSSDQVALTPQCPTDTMMCPNGSAVPRSGPQCEFAVCSQELPSYMKDTTVVFPAATTSTQPPENVSSSSYLKKLSSKTESLVRFIKKTIQEDVSIGLQETSNTPPSKTSSARNPSTAVTVSTPQAKSDIDETRYVVMNNTIIDQNNQVLYTFPANSSSPSSGYTETHIVNVVPVNTVAPVVGAIPITGLPGKYYLSENSFNANSECKFANKIYILDILANTRVLLYEENSETLQQEDPRSCTSEMFLLATEAEKLILKYHTVGTNMICESTWSEPEKTWYLDVTRPERGTKRYPISYALYQEAEAKESVCRQNVQATSTEPEIPSPNNG